MESLEQVVQDQGNQVSQDTDGGDEGAQLAPQMPEAAPQPAEKSLLDKIKEKGSVAPPATKLGDAEAAAQQVAEAFKPNYKFKAAGKELEVPEMLRSVMKDPASEKYMHSLLSKAHGIEMIQEKLKGTREDRDQLRHSYQEVMKPIEYAREAYGRNDMDTVFNTLKIDPNKVLQWAYQKVQLSQMPPDQRQVHEARQQAERRSWELERQSQELYQQGVSSQGEQLSQMLDLVLERPDVSALAQAYDSRKGKEGSFRDLVAMVGEQEYNRTGRVISPMEAAKAAAELLGEKFGAPAQQAQAAPAPQPQAQPAAAPEPKKIVLPNAGGARAASPGKSKIKSIDDIRKLHKQMTSN